jgi:hypothetical protein
MDNHNIHRTIGRYLETDENDKNSVSNSSSGEEEEESIDKQ